MRTYTVSCHASSVSLFLTACLPIVISSRNVQMPVCTDVNRAPRSSVETLCEQSSQADPPDRNQNPERTCYVQQPNVPKRLTPKFLNLTKVTSFDTCNYQNMLINFTHVERAEPDKDYTEVVQSKKIVLPFLVRD